MTPKEKAQEIINKFRHYSNGYKWTTTVAGKSVVLVDTEMQVNNAKQCALIAVDEILDATKTPTWNPDNWNEQTGFRYNKYWQEVKQEIEKL
jgi:hypothetical protein